MTSVRGGMSAQAAERLAAYNAQQSDWYSVCRVCKVPRTGTPVELKRPCFNCGATNDKAGS